MGSLWLYVCQQIDILTWFNVMIASNLKYVFKEFNFWQTQNIFVLKIALNTQLY